MTRKSLVPDSCAGAFIGCRSRQRRRRFGRRNPGISRRHKDNTALRRRRPADHPGGERTASAVRYRCIQRSRGVVAHLAARQAGPGNARRNRRKLQRSQDAVETSYIDAKSGQKVYALSRETHRADPSHHYVYAADSLDGAQPEFGSFRTAPAPDAENSPSKPWKTKGTPDVGKKLNPGQERAMGQRYNSVPGCR